MDKPILITAGHGKTGRRVAERLQQQGITPVIGSRSGQPPFDWDQPDGWDEVLKGIGQVYLTFQPDLAVPGSIEKISLFAEKAADAQVRKLVLLSGRGEKEAQACEKLVMDAGLDWTIARASWFMQNFSESFLMDLIRAGEVTLPVMNHLEPFIDADDIADVVLAALTDNSHSERLYELTGPVLLSFEQAVGMIAAALGRPIPYTAIGMDAYTSLLRTYEVPEDAIWLLQYLFTEVMDGRNESVTDDVENVLGRKPGSFDSYIAKSMGNGVWNQA